MDEKRIADGKRFRSLIIDMFTTLDSCLDRFDMNVHDNPANVQCIEDVSLAIDSAWKNPN